MALNKKFYRKKWDLTSAGEYSIGCYIDAALVATKSARVKQLCDGYKVLKYLNKSGQYRIYPFEKYHTIEDKPDKIGETNEVILSILDAQTNSKNIGYRNKRDVILIADNVPADELELLADLTTSPRVYLYIGTLPSDEKKDWLEVEISRSDNIVKQAKRKFSSIRVTVTLPENFNITML